MSRLEEQLAAEFIRLGVQGEPGSTTVIAGAAEYPWLASAEWLLKVLRTLPENAGELAVKARLRSELDRLRHSPGV
jgi:hypothetical protein